MFSVSHSALCHVLLNSITDLETVHFYISNSNQVLGMCGGRYCIFGMVNICVHVTVVGKLNWTDESERWEVSKICFWSHDFPLSRGWEYAMWYSC